MEPVEQALLVDIARISGVAISWIWDIENGAPASKRVKERIAKALEVLISELFPKEALPRTLAGIKKRRYNGLINKAYSIRNGVLFKKVHGHKKRDERNA